MSSRSYFKHGGRGVDIVGLPAFRREVCLFSFIDQPILITQPFFMSGYILGLVVEACMEHQKRLSTPGVHQDPIHVSAHYLRPTAAYTPTARTGVEAAKTRDAAQFEVHVRTVKKSRTFTNMSAELTQNVRHSSFSSNCLTSLCRTK